MPRLGVVIASIREGRIGLPIAQWFIERARLDGRFDVDVIDLKELDLPLFAERNHPRFQKYEHEKQKAWSGRVAALDAFVLVTPEYNHGTSPALLNALDYLFVEWHYKPVAFVSYGGISGGLRGVQHTKPTLAAMRMVSRSSRRSPSRSPRRRSRRASSRRTNSTSSPRRPSSTSCCAGLTRSRRCGGAR